MEELYIKIDNLKRVLDETHCIKKIKELNKELTLDNTLNSLVETYQLTKDIKVKEQIITNDLYKRYKHQEAELNLMILEINQELKKIKQKDKCGL